MVCIVLCRNRRRSSKTHSPCTRAANLKFVSDEMDQIETEHHGRDLFTSCMPNCPSAVAASPVPFAQPQYTCPMCRWAIRIEYAQKHDGRTPSRPSLHLWKREMRKLYIFLFVHVSFSFGVASQ